MHGIHRNIHKSPFFYKVSRVLREVPAPIAHYRASQEGVPLVGEKLSIRQWIYGTEYLNLQKFYVHIDIDLFIKGLARLCPRQVT